MNHLQMPLINKAHFLTESQDFTRFEKILFLLKNDDLTFFFSSIESVYKSNPRIFLLISEFKDYSKETLETLYLEKFFEKEN
jgi:hypothetical protein